jgi:hypothetical protein
MSRPRLRRHAIDLSLEVFANIFLVWVFCMFNLQRFIFMTEEHAAAEKRLREESARRGEEAERMEAAATELRKEVEGVRPSSSSPLSLSLSHTHAHTHTHLFDYMSSTCLKLPKAD